MTFVRRGFLFVLAIALIVLHAAFRHIKIDEISLALFLVVVLLLLWPDLQTLFSGLRRVKVGGLELELAEKVTTLERQAEKAQEEQAKKRPKKRTKKSRAEQIPPAVASRLAEAATDPRSALLLVAIELEQAIRRLAVQNKIEPHPSVTITLRQLVGVGSVSEDAFSSFAEFWRLRNKVIHEAGFDVSSAQMYRLVDVGISLLRLLSEAGA